MHLIQARGQTARTMKDPLAVAFGIAVYIGGHPSPEAAEVAGLPETTLANILRRLGVMRSHAEATRQRRYENGDVSATLPARRGILKREYTRQEAHQQFEQLCERFGVSAATLRKDMRAIGYTYDQATARSVARWGSLKAVHKAQRRAGYLRNEKDLDYRSIGEELGCAMQTARRLVDRWEERRSSE